MNTEKYTFNKSPLNTKQQIKLLEQRGLIIEDHFRSQKQLSSIGYYRFSGYSKIFQEIGNNPDHKFKDNIKFETIWDVYEFDRKLRLLILDAIERIEVALRVAISDCMSIAKGAFWYLDLKNYKRKDRFLDFMNKVDLVAGSKEQVFLKHYYKKYSDKYPPSWMLVECLTFGAWSKIYKNLAERKFKKEIADKFGASLIELESWMINFTVLRNACAHHERIWNRYFECTPKNIKVEKHSERKFYQQLLLMKKVISKISSDNIWLFKVHRLMEENSNLSFSHMGFSRNWKEDEIWTV